MNANESSRTQGSDPDDAPDLSEDGWPEKFARSTVRRERPPVRDRQDPQESRGGTG